MCLWPTDLLYIFILNISDDISKDGASLLCLVRELLPVITVHFLTGPQLLSLCPSLIPRVHLSPHQRGKLHAFHTNKKSTITECLKGLDDLCLNLPRMEGKGDQNKHVC